MLSKEQYEGIKASLAGATWVIDEEASDAEFLAANDNLAVTAEAISDPYVGTDSKVLQYTIKNYGNGNGTVYVSTKVLVNDNEEVTLKGAAEPSRPQKADGQLLRACPPPRRGHLKPH